MRRRRSPYLAGTLTLVGLVFLAAPVFADLLWLTLMVPRTGFGEARITHSASSGVFTLRGKPRYTEVETGRFDSFRSSPNDPEPQVFVAVQLDATGQLIGGNPDGSGDFRMTGKVAE